MLNEERINGVCCGNKGTGTWEESDQSFSTDVDISQKQHRAMIYHRNNWVSRWKVKRVQPKRALQVKLEYNTFYIDWGVFRVQ